MPRIAFTRRCRALLPVLALLACLPVAAHPSLRMRMPDAAVPQVREAFLTAPAPGEELDSLATWTAPDRSRAWVIVTGKATHRLSVYDAGSGALLRTVGGPGDGPGRFNRPNGIAVSGDVLFVIERDNHRVQALALPDFRPLGTFGADVLRSPYGVWIDDIAPGERDVFVTDSFMDGAHFDVVPPFAQLDRRVQRYRVWFGDEDGSLLSRHEGSFGATDPAHALRIVESIAGDPARGRLLVADEDTRHLSTLREYAFAGTPTGRSVAAGSYVGQAEGVALWPCGRRGGYWIGVDQRAPHTLFHLFDRASLRQVATFRGAATSGTDGIALDRRGNARFPDGALYAVDRDRAVAAFDLRAIARTLRLPGNCLR